jgi:glycosyltransferase involved in cell wall biosynthesis
MRVVHCLEGRPDPESLNGVNKTLHHLPLAQAALGLEVSVLAFDRAPPLPCDGVDVQTFARTALPFHVPAALVNALEILRPDVLHLHSPYFPEHATLARWARRGGVPYVISPHGALAPGELRHRWLVKLPYKHLFERPILNGAAFVHAVGAHEGLGLYGVRVPVVIVPNGVEPVVSPPTPAGRLVERHPELAGKRVLLYIGRLDPVQKGLDLLIAAVERAGFDDIALVIAGPDWRGFRRRIRRTVAARSTRAPVIVTEPLYGREKLEALLEADVFVHTSRWEGLPHAVLEAAALARPCLLSVAADPLGRLAEASAAVVVDPEVSSVADGIRRIRAMSADALRAMGMRARQLVEREFSWRRAADALRDQYGRHVVGSTG